VVRCEQYCCLFNIFEFLFLSFSCFFPSIVQRAGSLGTIIYINICMHILHVFRSGSHRCAAAHFPYMGKYRNIRGEGLVAAALRASHRILDRAANTAFGGELLADNALLV